MYSDRRGDGQNHPRQNLQDKKPRTKPLQSKTFAKYDKPFCKDICMCVCTTKNGGRCVTYFRGPTMCDKVRQKRGSKLDQNSVTYFMDGPIAYQERIKPREDVFNVIPLIVQIVSIFLNRSCVSVRAKEIILGRIYL